MDYAVKLCVEDLQNGTYLLRAKPTHDRLGIPDRQGDFGEILCNVVNYHNFSIGKIELECRGLSPKQMDVLENVVKMHNTLEDIKKLLK